MDGWQDRSHTKTTNAADCWAWQNGQLRAEPDLADVPNEDIHEKKALKHVPSLVTDVDIFSAVRTEVMLLFTGDMDLLFALKSLVGGRCEVGSEGRVLTFPSDAR